jgi:lipoate-protein ligase A
MLGGRKVKVVTLRAMPILQQLITEEVLLRATQHNYVVINYGAPDPTIVLGFSGKIRDLVNVDLAARDNIQTIRRYTGGGTVICDSNTAFVSFIMNITDVPVKPYPRDIMSKLCSSSRL